MSLKYNWDLESLLKGKTIDYLYQEWYRRVEQQTKDVNHFYESKQRFAKWLKENDEIVKISNRLSNYISNHNSEDLSNPVWTGWLQRLSHDATIFGQKLCIYTNLVLKNENTIRSYLKDKALSKYLRDFELIFKDKPHTLDDKSESLLAKLSADGGSVGDVFNTLLDNDLKYKDALDKKNKPHKITTQADVSKLLKNKDRVLRKNTWINFNSAIDSVKNTISKTLYYNYLRANSWAKTRNYKDYIDATLQNDEVDRELLLSIYDNVEQYKDIFVKFKKARNAVIKKIYKLSKIEPWDLSLDLYSKKVKYTIEQAQAEVIEALKPLGLEYIYMVKKAFNENWISWLPKQNKLTGAYSIGGTYGLDKYYILMNFDGSSDSVSTIAHEMGHSMNSYYINKHQDVYADVDMFVAEIASIVNEMLLNYYWLNKYKNNKAMKLHIYENMISTFFACTSRQITFSKFEYMANELINAGQPFTVETAKDLYTKALKQYEGLTSKGIARLKKYPYSLANSTILRIPHFYANSFYVYKYAIGQIVAIVVANRIFNKDQEMINNYKKFLSAGYSIPPLEIIKLLKLDLKKKEIYSESKKILNKLVNEFIKLK